MTIMGSGYWFKTLISWKKAKQDQSKQVKGDNSERSNGYKWRNQTHESNELYNVTASGNPRDFGMTIEDRAAIQIQIAFRGFRARKTLRHLKRKQRLQALIQAHPVRWQASTTLSYLHSWRKIQMEIRARRTCMVTEGRIRQKKPGNQLKLEAMIHDLEVEWCGGSETTGEILSKIQLREEAAIKRERSMAYAFSHQWRASASLNHHYEFGNGTWGWSWMERWIAARPWERRLPTKSVSPSKTKSKAVSKGSKNTELSVCRVSDPVKPSADNRKDITKRSQSREEKTASQEPNTKPAAPPQSQSKNAKLKQKTQLSLQPK